jgi:NAD(P)-dependent dehydrogenase (short-subunit alcohol dehydrogenase family)
MTLTASTAKASEDKLVGAVAIVTGASNGIGAAVARALVAAGASVVGVDREASTVAGVESVSCDLTDSGATMVGWTSSSTTRGSPGTPRSPTSTSPSST